MSALNRPFFLQKCRTRSAHALLGNRKKETWKRKSKLVIMEERDGKKGE